jgi:hypothetical protein
MAKSDGGDKGDGQQASRLMGSLREALAAASRDDSNRVIALGASAKTEPPTSVSEPLAVRDGVIEASEKTIKIASGAGSPPPLPAADRELPSAQEAAREARGGTPNIPPVDRHVEFEVPPTTTVDRQQAAVQQIEEDTEEMAPTQLVRGKHKVERGAFQQDPVVGWLVIVGGPGIGAYRPIFEGNNTIGRAGTNRVAIDFGDDAISAEEQAYIRYDSTDRSFLFVPNLAKTNVVSVNDQRPASPVGLQGMDVIIMGRTQLVFVPFCGADFDWSELTEQKK